MNIYYIVKSEKLFLNYLLCFNMKGVEGILAELIFEIGG